MIRLEDNIKLEKLVIEETPMVTNERLKQFIAIPSRGNLSERLFSYDVEQENGSK
jgi:hypothetical protein